MAGHENTHGIWLKSAGESHDAVEHILHAKAGLSEEKAKELIEQAHHGVALISGLKPEKAESLIEELKAGRHGRRRRAENAQMAPALRRADQSAGHQPDRRQHVHPDLFVGHDGAGSGRHPGRKEEERLVLPSGHRLDRVVLPWSSGLRILSIDGRAPLPAAASAPRGISAPASACSPRVSSP